MPSHPFTTVECRVITPSSIGFSQADYLGALNRVNIRQRRFVEEYLIDLNASAAARRAGYKGGSSVTNRLLALPEIDAAVRAGMMALERRNRISQDEVIAELRTLAFAALPDLMDWGYVDGVPYLDARPSHEIPPALRGAVQEVAIVGGRLRVKLHGKVEALIALGRHLGMFRDPIGRAAPDTERPGDFGAVIRQLSDVPEAVRDQISALLAGPY